MFAFFMFDFTSDTDVLFKASRVVNFFLLSLSLLQFSVCCYLCLFSKGNFFEHRGIIESKYLKRPGISGARLIITHQYRCEMMSWRWL